LNQESKHQNFILFKPQAKQRFGEFALGYHSESCVIHLKMPFDLFAGHFNSVPNFTDWNSNIICHRYYINIDGLAFHFR